MIRPGGLELTGHALSLAGLMPGCTVFDIGCGSGETVRYLREQGFEARGIDLSAGKEPDSCAAPFLEQADAAAMPFETASADGLLFECSFTKMKEPEQVLREAFRVLKPEGRLVITDMTARKEEAVFDGYLGRLETEEHFKNRLTEAGFVLLAEEQHDSLVRIFSGNLILQKGTREAERLLGGPLSEIRRCAPGYLLLVLKKRKWTGKCEFMIRETEWSEESGFMTPEALSEAPERFLALPQTKVKRVVTLGTSGTSAKPKRIFFSERDLEDTVDGFVSGLRPMVSAGQTAGILFPGTGENGLPQLIRAALERLGVRAEICSAAVRTGTGDFQEKDSLLNAVTGENRYGEPQKGPEELRRQISFCAGKDFLTGLPGDIYRLAKHAPGLRPETVLLSGDSVPESLRSAVSRIWGCEIYTHYGMTETGYCLAVECPAHQGLHLWTGGVTVETADPDTGRLLPAGEEGELIITTHRREAMPLVRYRTGDIGRLAPDGDCCACGSRTPRIMKLSGRKDQPPGVPRITALSEFLYGIPQISAFRAERVFSRKEQSWQNAPDRRHLRLTLELISPLDQEELKKCLEARFQGTEFELTENGTAIPVGVKNRII